MDTCPFVLSQVDKKPLIINFELQGLFRLCFYFRKSICNRKNVQQGFKFFLPFNAI